MTLPTHIIVGPEQHGVVEYAQLLAHHAGGHIVRFTRWEELPANPCELPAGPWQIFFTDHLFGSSPKEAVDRVLSLSDGHPLSVSFHDIPQVEEGADRFARRASAYIKLAEAADHIIVNSHHESAFFSSFSDQAPHGDHAEFHPLVVPLPLPARTLPDSAVPPPRDLYDSSPSEAQVEPRRNISIMGFIYPGKGHQELLDSLAAQPDHPVDSVHALGRLAAGHEWLEPVLAQSAKRAGVEFSITGFLSTDDLERAMLHADIPVCAHRHFSASGSLMKWIGLGRKVLVADSPYSRELQARWPGFVVRVENDAWLDAIRNLPADFTQTLPPPSDWTWENVASMYHHAWTTNGWDLALNSPMSDQVPDYWPLVTVVIPFFNNPGGLRDILKALENQDYPGELECVVADDGSTILPDFHKADYSFPVVVVRQEDQGFRAAAVRNLGAEAANGEILAFIDGDTVPHPSYLKMAVRLPTLDHRALVVGRRVHGPSDVSESADTDEPKWLRAAYARTGELANADDTSWRFVISAVLTCHKDFFTSLGGFDSTLVGYGGEDWEFAWRAWNAGAILHRNDQAIAVHPAPDWAGRIEDEDTAIRQKNAESLALAKRIAHPIARPDSVIFPDPHVLVRVPMSSSSWAAGAAVSVISGWLMHSGVHIAVPAAALTNAEQELFSSDLRIVLNEHNTRCPIEVSLHAPAWPESRENFRNVSNRANALGGLLHIVADNAGGQHDKYPIAEIYTARREALRRKKFETPPATTVSVAWAMAEQPRRIERDFAGW